MGEQEVGVVVADGRAASFSYGLEVKWAQIAYLTGRELQLFRKLAAGPEHRRYFCYEILDMVLDRGGELLCVEPPGMTIAEVDWPKDIPNLLRVAAADC
jgi:hypothetical protein